MACLVVRAQAPLDSDALLNVTSHTGDFTASVTSSCGDVIDALRRRHLNQSSDDVITLVPTQQMSETSDDGTSDDDSEAAGGRAGDGDEAEYSDEDELDSPTEQRLMRQLLRRYERAVRPVRNASDTVMIRMGLTLTQIFNMVSHHRPAFSCSVCRLRKAED